MNIKLIQRGAVQSLYDTVPQNLERYKSGDFTSLKLDEHIKEIADTNFHENVFLKLEPIPGGKNDAKNALIVVQSLEGLTPYLARDERIWVHLTHFAGLEYTRKRWLNLKGKDDDRLIKDIRLHFFARGNRGFERNNSLSCLWWWAEVASRFKDTPFDKTLDAFLRYTDVRAQIIERPTMSRNENIFIAIMSVITKRIFDDPNPDFFSRSPGIYREWFKDINKQGGLRLLASLPLKDLKNLFERLAVSAETNSSGAKVS